MSHQFFFLSNKLTGNGDIPEKHLKDSDIYSKELTIVINIFSKNGCSLVNSDWLICEPFSRKIKMLIRRIREQPISYLMRQRF